jgi:hypothetical protein
MNPNINRDRASHDRVRSTSTKNPAWWGKDYDSAWDRVKEAFRRDWVQTKSDFGGKTGRELNQDVDDTVKQAVGKDPVPPAGVPNVDDEFGIHEPAFRYGFGSRSYYRDHKSWDDTLDTKLRGEWDNLGTGRRYDEARPFIRRGWDYNRI